MPSITPVLNVDSVATMKSFDVAQASGGDSTAKIGATGDNEGLMSVRASDLKSTSSANPMNAESFSNMMSGVYNKANIGDLEFNSSKISGYNKETDKVDEIKRNMTPEFEIDSSLGKGYGFGDMMADYKKIFEYKNFIGVVAGVSSSVSKSVKMLIRQG